MIIDKEKYPPDWRTVTGEQELNFTGEIPIVVDRWLVERVKSVRNQCDMFLVLAENANAYHTLHTLLEDMAYRVQEIISDYCSDEDKRDEKEVST